jgi:hypothetical protein
MDTIDYRALAGEWMQHVVDQYEVSHTCAEDLALIEHLLKEGFTLIAMRDQSKRLWVDFLAKKSPRERLPVSAAH